ncbi:polyketide synthase type I [Actinoplanes sp. SE50]|uniref:CurL C-terminal domain-containing protein n=1 Tax=unclassified Actinoplanes TaxID=2626549 RepID=UPI00023EC872|nr:MULTISPECIES: polyketide synthase [unclassified Actinoplanes]AEV87080.1 polyketide synthase type I [Actinoplanes sp. SE50/110]ATO85478.1 polyketide synthase type I [Actinoplanes sp. SE50]SLM02890.1 polyketide synthase [Actinoplanes sp. SE50/110]
MSIRFLPLSARSAATLTRLRERIADHLVAHPRVALDDVAATLSRGREPFRYRCVVVAGDRDGTVAALRGERPTIRGAAPAGRAPRLVFRFGDGARDGFGRDAYDRLATVRRVIDDLDAALTERFGAPVRLLDAAAGGTPAAPGDRAAAVTVAVGYAIAEQLREWGVTADTCTGAGVGARTAAVLAGELDITTAVAQAWAGEPHSPAPGTAEPSPSGPDTQPAAPDVLSVEIGPRPGLSPAGDIVVAVLPGEDEVAALAAAAAEVWCLGADVVLSAPGDRVHLPGYPFERAADADPRPAAAQAVTNAWREVFGTSTPGTELGPLVTLRRAIAARWGYAPTLPQLAAAPDDRQVLADLTEIATAESGSTRRERPLTAREQRLVFHDAVRAGSSSAEHTVQLSIPLEREPDPDALDAALRDAQLARPLLRTVFRRRDDRWVAAEMPHPLVTLTRSAPGAEAADHAFQPVDAPLLHVALRPYDDRTDLVVALHQALADHLDIHQLAAELLDTATTRSPS